MYVCMYVSIHVCMSAVCMYICMYAPKTFWLQTSFHWSGALTDWLVLLLLGNWHPVNLGGGGTRAHTCTSNPRCAPLLLLALPVFLLASVMWTCIPADSRVVTADDGGGKGKDGVKGGSSKGKGKCKGITSKNGKGDGKGKGAVHGTAKVIYYENLIKCEGNCRIGHWMPRRRSSVKQTSVFLQKSFHIVIMECQCNMAPQPRPPPTTGRINGGASVRTILLRIINSLIWWPP